MHSEKFFFKKLRPGTFKKLKQFPDKCGDLFTDAISRIKKNLLRKNILNIMQNKI